MEQEHRDAIQKNYKTLVDKVNLRELLPSLEQKGVFSHEQSERYKIDNHTEIKRKRDLFLDIQRRGPFAFGNLIESLEGIDLEHKKIALTLQGKETSELENNNYETVKEIEEKKPTENTKGAWPYRLPGEQRPPHIRQLSHEIPNANIHLGQEPLKVKVKKSDRWLDIRANHKVPVYPMHSKNRGIFLCINNIEFANGVHDKRLGAEVDEDNLKDLFKQMGFTIQSYRDQSKLDMKRVVENFVENETRLKNIDCVVVAIMSHGIEGETRESSKIIASDAKALEVSWLLEQFNNRNCQALINKPKIFILQICRGNNPHVGVKVQPNHPPSFREIPPHRIQSDGLIPCGRIVRDLEDMLIAFSTLPGDKSYRDTYLGTWYMQSICKVFMEHAHDTDIESLLKLVDWELKTLRSGDGNMQTSSYENRGFHLCFLHPGIYQDENKKIKHYNDT